MTKYKFSLLFSVLALLAIPAGARADEILVSAAISLTDSFTEIGRAFMKSHPGTTFRFNFAASGALQQQIVQGAPVDVFVSASPKEMDALQKAGRIEAATRLDFAGNRLVLIAKNGSLLKKWEDLKQPSIKHIAISNPDSVPSGRYAKETLTKRGLWNAIQPKLVLGENVRQTLTYVANGDADAGMVFATDAAIEKQRVHVAQEAIPGKDHAPIVYPAAVVAKARNARIARLFVAFLKEKPAQMILAKYGFAPLPTAQPPKKRQ